MTMMTLDDLTMPAPDPSPADWNDDGVVVLRNFIPEWFIKLYLREWEDANGSIVISGSNSVLDLAGRGGWQDDTPYLHEPYLRRLVCDGKLAAVLQELLGEAAGVHLNLTGLVSTERDWHQDSYLNPPHVGDYYAAVWFALGDINPDSGPFQYVPGSHLWPQVTREKILEALGPGSISDPMWPKRSEEILTPLFEAEIERRGAEVVSYLPERGDVLIWHGRLLHRGSKAKVHGAYRPALIAHYSGVWHRQDMPPAVRHDAGGWYFPLFGGVTR